MLLIWRPFDPFIITYLKIILATHPHLTAWFMTRRRHRIFSVLPSLGGGYLDCNNITPPFFSSFKKVINVQFGWKHSISVESFNLVLLDIYVFDMLWNKENGLINEKIDNIFLLEQHFAY